MRIHIAPESICLPSLRFLAVLLIIPIYPSGSRAFARIQTAGDLWWLDAQMPQIVLQEYQVSRLIGEFLEGRRGSPRLYSYRNATMGSICVARRAGISAANIAT